MWDDRFDDDDDKAHPALSPAAGAESLFLAGLATAHISANALAEQLRKNVKNPPSYTSLSSMSVATDDFVTAVENPDDLISVEDFDDNKNISETIPELDTESDTDAPEQTSRGLDFTMATKASTAPTSTNAPKKDMKAPPKATGDAAHVDAASHAYEHVKGAWAWGKGLPVVSMFLGVTEAVAGKVVGVAGTNLGEIDGNIKPQLANLDTSVLNPAIATLVGVLLGAAGKTEDIVKPIIIMLLSPFGLIKNEAENPEVTMSKK